VVVFNQYERCIWAAGQQASEDGYMSHSEIHLSQPWRRWVFRPPLLAILVLSAILIFNYSFQKLLTYQLRRDLP
jgi:hypothetical protein